MDIAALLSPIAVEDFAAEYLDNKPLVIRGAGSSANKALLDWSGFEQVSSVMSNWPAKWIRLVRDGEVLENRHYLGRATDEGVSDTARSESVDMARVHRYLAEGFTFVGSRLERVVPAVESLARQFSNRFCVHATAHVFCSFKRIAGLSSHFDNGDVWVVQCEGEKRWQVFANRYPNPVAGEQGGAAQDFDAGETIFDEVLKPGDVLYIPKGFSHAPTAVSNASLHVTFALRQLTAASLLDLLPRIALEDPDFRQQLPDLRDGNHSDADEVLAILGDKLRDLVSSDAVKSEIARIQKRKSQSWSKLDVPEILASARYFVTDQLEPYAASELLSAQEQAVVDWMVGKPMFAQSALAAEFSFLSSTWIETLLIKLVDAGCIARASRG